MKGNKLSIFKIIGKKTIFLIAYLIFSSCCSTTLSILTPLLLQRLINYINNSTNIENPIPIPDDFIKIAIMIITFFICRFILFDIPYNLIKISVDQKNGTKLRGLVFEKFKKLPYDYFQKTSPGHNMTVVIHDCGCLCSSFVGAIAQTFSAFFLLIAIIITMFIMTWKLAIICIIAVPVISIIIPLVVRKTKKLYRERWPSLSKLNTDIEEKFSNTLFIRSSNKEQKITADFEKINYKYYRISKHTNFFSGLTGPLLNIVNYLCLVAIVITAAILTTTSPTGDRREINAVPSFLLLIGMFTSPFTTISNNVNSLTNSFVCFERIKKILSHEDEQKEVALIPKFNTAMDIRFENVSFSYDNKKTILKNITFDAQSGEKIAIIGPTGSGKTTIANLLMRFYDVKEGAIKIGGVNINDINNDILRTMFSIIPQEPWFFQGTIKENLIYNSKNITDEKMKKCCEETDCLHFILTQPKQFNTMIDNNTSMSAGEKQLLAITRQVLANKHFVIMDEATSNVDTQTEQKIQKAIDKLSSDKITFVIAHRLSTIKNANKIIVLNNGKIEEIGNHRELLNKKGMYYKLFNSQFADCD